MRALPCLLAGFALFAPWGAQAAGSDPICAQVQAIVADAANGFAKFQGELTKKENSSVEPPTTVDYYAASGAPAGAVSCDIEIQETASSDGHHYPNYACQFPIAGADKGAAVRKLANQIVACLPGTSRPSGPGLDKQGGMLDAHANDYSVSYQFLAGPAKPTALFSIQSERK